MSCHRRIDPFGLAFENFDAVGGWRETVQAEDGQQPVDISLALDGKAIDSPNDLKRYILNHRLDAFAQGFVKNLLQYAVGRQLDLLDDDSVERAQRAFVNANYDFKVLVQAVAASESFRASE